MTDREQFEKWVQSKWPIADLERGLMGEYVVSDLESHWQGWQAARAAPAQSEPQQWTRAPKHDRRIGHGDDFSGDAWVSQEEVVHYTAVGEGPPRQSGDTR